MTHPSMNDQPCDTASTRLHLSPRQKEILALVAQGATDNEIALRLGLSSASVSQYMKRIRARLGACSRAHAVALGMRQGILVSERSQQEEA
jgi:DNA-binding CsgD family transcriptional regulator